MEIKEIAEIKFEVIVNYINKEHNILDESYRTGEYIEYGDLGLFKVTEADVIIVERNYDDISVLQKRYVLVAKGSWDSKNHIKLNRSRRFYCFY